MKNKAIIILIMIGIIIIGLHYFTAKQGTSTKNQITIGVITPLTGGVAYWGESAQTGIELAKKDLTKEGIQANVIVEDGQLNAAIALSAAQKLVSIDKVQAIYAEFNPAAISVSSDI